MAAKGLYAAIAAFTLAGCASVATQLPHISLPDLTAERKEQEGLAFAEMAKHQARLARVAAPILKANAELCPRIGRDIGVKTHNLKSYPKAVRAAAARTLGADAQHSVLYIRPQSPAEKAGLLRGDRLLDQNNIIISANSSKFETALKDGEGRIRILRNGDIHTVMVIPDMICGYKIKLSLSSNINAYADGKHIIVTSGMLNFVKNDAELALIIGHELGHNTMGHIRKIISNMILSGLARRYTRPFESEADYVGLYYIVRAGYSPDNVEDVWRRLAAQNPKSVVRAKTHPTYPDRYLRLAAARAEIQAKQIAGEPLLPNFKRGTQQEDDGS